MQRNCCENRILLELCIPGALRVYKISFERGENRRGEREGEGEKERKRERKKVEERIKKERSKSKELWTRGCG